MKKKFIKPKIRRKWAIKPATKAHSTQKGAKGYNRKTHKKIEENEKTYIILPSMEGLKIESKQDISEARR